MLLTSTVFFFLFIHSVSQALRGRKVTLQSLERGFILVNLLAWIGRRK
jgi:hypothetical protein